MVDFQIVVIITWRYPSGRNYISYPIVTQGPSSKRSYLTPDDEGDYTCTAQMFVDEVLIKKTKDIYQFFRRKITFFLSHNNIILQYTALASIILSVDVTGSRVNGLVGTSYTLTCTVTLSTRISQSPVHIQCEGPGQSHYEHNDRTDDTVIVYEVEIDRLTLADDGDYTCIARYKNPLDPIVTNGSGNMSLSILSK